MSKLGMPLAIAEQSLTELSEGDLQQQLLNGEPRECTFGGPVGDCGGIP